MCNLHTTLLALFQVITFSMFSTVDWYTKWHVVYDLSNLWEQHSNMYITG
jgi:hypothetical protein